MTTKYRITEDTTVSETDDPELVRLRVNKGDSQASAIIFRRFLTPLEEDDPDTVRVPRELLEKVENYIDGTCTSQADHLVSELLALRTPEPEKDWLDERLVDFAKDWHRADEGSEKGGAFQRMVVAIRRAVAENRIRGEE